MNQRGESPVVVTGVGVIAGNICGTAQLRALLTTTMPPLVEVNREAGYHLDESSRMAVLGSTVDVSPWISPAAGRRMSRPSRFAVAAARMALTDASLPHDVGPDTAVVVSNAIGAADYSEKLLRAVFLEGPEAVSPFTFTESVSNAPAAQIAIACQARGPNITIVQREAGILTAVGRGAAEVASGRVERAMVGGVEEMPPIAHAFLDRLDSLARPEQDRRETARPFDRRRHGFVAAEGAVVLVLETEEAARSRNAKIHARVRGFGAAFDPTSPRVGWGRGEAPLSLALRGMLERAHLNVEGIGRIVSGANGSIAGDRLEALTLRNAWKNAPLPPVIAPKGVTGQYGGGFLASALLAVNDQEFGPTAGFEEEDPELGVVPHAGGALPESRFTLVTSLASGGTATWLVLEKI